MPHPDQAGIDAGGLRFVMSLRATGERIIFPVSTNETNGIEDARFVMFTEDDGSVKYYATYTACNGHSILPQFIETEAGWLVITHGVGPMRKYCIGAALLDLKDPRKVIGRLSRPLLAAEGEEREGYVPNVVYSCGAMLHGRTLILSFAASDRVSRIASVSLDDLLAELVGG